MSTDATYAAAPFDHAKADVILRSSDKVDFRVFKLFLSLASPFFETLFTLPQPTDPHPDQEIRDCLPVVPVTEDSKTLDTFLRLCYPCSLADDPHIETSRDALNVLNAAGKYSLDTIEKKACQAILNTKLLEGDPLRYFVFAHRGRLHDETLLAAKYMLTQPLVPPWFQEIDLISTRDLLSVLTYHQECGDAVYALRHKCSWITSHYQTARACSWFCGGCSHNGCPCGIAPGASRYKVFDCLPCQWWEDFMAETFTKLRDKPCKATVRASVEKTIRKAEANFLPSCSSRITEDMHKFSKLFERKVEATVSSIKLKLDF